MFCHKANAISDGFAIAGNLRLWQGNLSRSCLTNVVDASFVLSISTHSATLCCMLWRAECFVSGIVVQVHVTASQKHNTVVELHLLHALRCLDCCGEFKWHHSSEHATNLSMWRCNVHIKLHDCVCILHVLHVHVYVYVHVHVLQLHSLLCDVNTYTSVIAAWLASRRSAKALYRWRLQLHMQ